MKLPANVQKQVTEGKREMKIERDDLQEGDPRYMAPELLRGDYGTAADIFRLANVKFFMSKVRNKSVFF